MNSYTVSEQRFQDLAMDSDGDFTVVWSSNGQDGASFGVFARRFTSAGTSTGTEFQVNSYTSYSQLLPTVAMDGDGSFVVAWQTYRDGSSSGIFARRFSAAGTPHATEFQVNSYTTDYQYQADVAMSSEGEFVVVWGSVGQDGSDDSPFSGGGFGRRFDASGWPRRASSK